MKKYILISIVVGILLVISQVAHSRNKKDHVYETGKLLDITIDTTESVSYRTRTYKIGDHYYSHMDPYTVRRQEYFLHVKLKGIVYVARYTSSLFKSYRPADLIVGDPIEVRFKKKKMYIKRPDGKEMKSKIVKRVRVKRKK